GRDLQRLDRPPRTSPSPEGSPVGPESPPAGKRHRHQRTDEIAAGAARSIRLCESTRRLRRPPANPRSPPSPDHTHPPGRFFNRGSADRSRRAILPTDPRLPGPLPAGLADPQAAGDAERPGGVAAGGTVGVVECQTREPTPAIGPGMVEHPVADP